MAGLTRICSVEGYYILDGEKVAKDGQLSYRGYDINDIVSNCVKENRFGFEEVVWLLLFGDLPTANQLDSICEVIDVCRFLPDDFIEDMIIKNPSKDIMNKIARSILGLYSYDENPDDISVQNVLRQSLQLVAQFPTIMTTAYQVKRRAFYGKSMYLHPIKRGLSTAEYILRQTRSDKLYSDDEAKLLDIMLMLHADHGGGNNSTFATRVLTSSGTDTYSAIAAGVGSLKGPRHGGANLKTSAMMNEIIANVADSTDKSQVKDYLVKILNKEAGDGLGLIYGMGHAVYTISDPRAVILKNSARELAYRSGFEKEFKTLENIEEVTPELLHEIKGDDKEICANVDLYSGLCYKVLGIPEDLYTPLFASARIAGWCAHRLEELTSSKRIIRPAYKSVSKRRIYTPIEKDNEKSNFSVCGAFCFWLGCAAAFAALALRCVQVFKYTDYETAHVLKSASESVAAFYSLLAASVVFFALSVIKCKPFSAVNRMRGKSIFALCLLSGAGMFYDFVYRCILCFDYVSSTQHPAANRLTPMICTAIFALFSAAFFIALGISFKTTRYQMSSLWFLYISPVMWAISGLLSLLTVYDDVFLPRKPF